MHIQNLVKIRSNLRNAAMLDRYGEKELNKFTKEIDLYGGNYRALTEGEERHILSSASDIKSLNALRDRIIAKRKQGSRRILQEGVQGQTPTFRVEPTETDTTLYELEQDELEADARQAIDQGMSTPEWNNYFKSEGGLFVEGESADNGSVDEIEANLKNSIEKINALLLKPKDTSKGVQRESIGKVQAAEIALIKNELDIDVTGYDYTIDVSEINHTKNRHPDLTNKDFELIPYIILNYDTLEYSGKNKKGLDAIVYKKEFDKTTILVEEIRTGKKELAFNTMYKKNAGGGSLQTPSAFTSKTTPDTSLSSTSPEKSSGDNFCKG
ncbi:MAG: hypothetical protein Ta2G_20570 [Termitinemataceae bacterium]|nr:MAG: hypothetical protein Ta2G_20570 [Termitinemataceae bacterium]